MSLISSLAQMSAQNTATSQAFAREQMAFQAEQNKLARDWQERMSNTAHQRQVKDLQAAGLNPILSVNSGAQTGSASGASGASGTVDTSAINALASLAVASMNIASNERMHDNALKNAIDIAMMQTKSAESVSKRNRGNTLYGNLRDIFDGIGDTFRPYFGDNIFDYFANNKIQYSGSADSIKTSRYKK